MNIDKLIPNDASNGASAGFGSLMNIDKLIQNKDNRYEFYVLAL